MLYFTNNPKIRALKNAISEYLSHAVFIAVFYFIYFHLPYFQTLLQPQAKNIISALTAGYIVLGAPYFIFRNYFKPGIYLKSENKSAIALKFFLEVFTSFPRIKFTPKIRTAILSLVLKFFYFPLMLSFVIGNFYSTKYYWGLYNAHFPSLPTFINWSYYLVLNFILVIDTAIFTFGYAFEAKWLGNEIKSVDPHISGWFFTLICYPPFNSLVERSTQNWVIGRANLLSNPSLMPVFRVATLLFYIIYVWATVALWTKSSNLTNRGIVAVGPYKYVRHPAYMAKNIAWWLEQLPFIASLGGVLVLIFWNIIYIMRAITEERHLGADSDYRRYIAKVKYRFIPGVV